MFAGHFVNSIDSKGRVSIPSYFRQLLTEKGFNSLILTNHPDGCLYAYPPDEWENILNKVSKLPQSKKEVKAFQRFVISSAVECQIDKQGRILIPHYQREFAKIEKEVLFAGVGTRIEIWSKNIWDIEIEKSKNILEESETLAELGL